MMKHNSPNIQEAFLRLKDYCEAEDYMGWDPFDGLNSRLLALLKFPTRSRLIRLGWLQLVKRAPFNLRPVLGIPKHQNPKGIALFLSGYCHLFRESKDEILLPIIHKLAHILITNQSKGWSGACWGYPFPWQARAFFQPAHTPTVVATTYCANALLDAWEITKHLPYKETALSSAQFIIHDLKRDYSGQDLIFSYSPLDQSRVYNASLLGARLLARIWSITPDRKDLKQLAESAVNYVIKKQSPDGSWPYGEKPYHQWIDSFHTGFNLECLADFTTYTQSDTALNSLKIGINYYLNNFFSSQGESKYYNNQLYPIDVHAPAQLIVTLYRTGELSRNIALVERVLRWTIQNMQDNKGYFYYQKRVRYISKTPFMRWAQAWMFNSLCIYLSVMQNQGIPPNKAQKVTN